MAKGLKEADPIFYALGGRGRYQFAQFVVASLVSFSAGFQLLNFVFIGRSIPHTCTAPDNLTDIFNVINDDRFSLNTSRVEFDECNIRVFDNISGSPETVSLSCIYGYTYAERKDLSIIADMDVVCDKAALKGLGQTLLILGQGLGALSLPAFSDRYGRRPILLISHLLMLIIGIGVAFSPSYLVFLILRICLGIAQQGVVLTMQTYGVEMYPAKYRKIIGLFGTPIWTSAIMLISLVAYLGRNLSWRTLQLIYTSVSLYVFVQFFIMDESLRWLTAKGRDKEIVRLLKKAARVSRKKTEDVLQVYQGLKMEAEKKEKQKKEEESLLETEQTVNDFNGDIQQNIEGQELVFNTLEGQKGLDSKKNNVAKSSFLDLLKTKRLALNVAVLWFIWMVDSMTFFGMFMTAHSLAGSRYINFFLFALVEAPSAFLIYAIVDRYGRRKASTTLHSIAGIALIAATVIKHIGGESHSETAVTALSCIGVFGISGAWGTSFFLTPEMFPTNLRNFGLGTCSSFSRIGGMLAPFASLLADYLPWAPGAIFGGCCMMVTVLVHVLPETKGRELPQTLQDLQGWYRKEGTKKEEKNGSVMKRKLRQTS